MSECCSGPGASRGFTLIELMVVVIIIGMISAGAIIAMGSLGQDRELDRETERILALLRYTKEQAELQTREFGLLAAAGSYAFVTFEARTGAWRTVDEDDALRRRTLPGGLGMSLVIEGREVVLPREASADDLTPQVMIFSNGDLTSFELKLVRDSGATSTRIQSDENGRIVTDAELEQEKNAPPPAAGSASTAEKRP